MNDLIVETEIVSVGADGTRHPMTIEIGKPYPDGQDFACRVALRGLHDHIAPIIGGDQMQALVLAISLIRSQLQVLEEQGYKIILPEDTEDMNSITEIWFSSLGMRKPEQSGGEVRV